MSVVPHMGAPRAFRARLRAAAFALVLIAGAACAASALQLDSSTGGAGAMPEPSKLVKARVQPVVLHAGEGVEAVVRLTIQAPWHINANPPSPDYMIPTQVELSPGFGVRAAPAIYPPAHALKVDFDSAPLAVYDHEATIRLPLRAAVDAAAGSHVLRGKIRFQACNDQVCMAPASVPFEIGITVVGGAPAADSTDSASTGAAATNDSAATDTAALGTTGPLTSVKGSDANNPIARGGFLAFVALFLFGLGLNLTPCVYPMLGVTVSIFGARSAAPPMKVFGSALVYVLGMSVMYTSLGVAAALTGKLFGALLQNPMAVAGIGVLLIVMSLSMFGLFELQPPAWLLSRLGGSGTTGAIGLFVSGLVVGVVAAPCVGPAVIGLLTIVGAKADPWFGFVSFFTLSLGLGAPYLLLGTFSGLIQRLPRSGDWMVWVKKVFGVILVAVGLFYVCIAFAPRLATWVAPAALLAGGLYLGFLEKSAAKRPAFAWLKRATGVVGIALGTWLVASAPTQALVFRPYDAAAVKQALASGRPVILEFSADWCIPCHELERSTFTHAGVIAAAREFEVFRVDLTHSDSPEATARVREYNVRGVPTVVFLAPDGREVEAARFSGFLPPEQFLERLKAVAGATKQG